MSAADEFSVHLKTNLVEGLTRRDIAYSID